MNPIEINIIVGVTSIICGTILGNFLGWFNIKKSIILKERISEKKEFRKTIISLISKIKYDKFSQPGKLWIKLHRENFIIDEAMINLEPYIGSSDRKKLKIAYDYYKNPYPDYKSLKVEPVNNPFLTYSAPDEKIKEIFNLRDVPNGSELAIHNLKKIIEIVS
jgi:hypothetical protein